MITSCLEILQKTSHYSRIPIEDVSFVFCMLLNLPLGVFYRKVLNPHKVSSKCRMTFGLLWGFVTAWICFGSQLLNLIAVTALCFTLTCIVKPAIVHRYVFVASFFCLSMAQLYRMVTNYGQNRFDYTTSLMLMTQKFTYVAFSLHDGLGREDIKLTNDQRREKIVHVPKVLEYFAYVFHYSTLFVGPVCTYKEYLNFIEGKDLKDIDFDKNGNQKYSKREPSPTKAAMAKFLEMIIFGLLTAFAAPKFPVETNGDPAFTSNNPFLFRVLYAWISMVLFRCRYYFAFAMGETSSIISGMGFNGLSKEGRTQWNKLPCANAFSVEFATSVKMAQDNWNIFTLLWLRRIVKDRVRKYTVFFVYATTAVWHGFYPVYYAAAPSMLLATFSARSLRRTFKPYVDSLSPVLQMIVSVVSWVMVHNMISYSFVPFAMLRFDLGIHFLISSMYLYGHIICFVILLSCQSSQKRTETCSYSVVDHKSTANGYLNNNNLK